ncbi:phage virion morphogenesis protein [Gemmobacter serpentinus]|uniref:phage virion morphogenesis protein n=1 Tax=Gemmobacter serpentinus TaxID=2652247 RepID=UPI00124CE94E|nr:phage virion morphogenesis protein [Gemmobacter serpentinus]
MTGVAVEADFSVAARALGRLTDEQLALLAYEIGALVEDQTKLRIADEKRAPDGTPWVPWSEAYDNTRNHAKHSLLVGEGNPGLLESIQNYTTGLQAVVGTPLIYGAIHQFGGPEGARDPDLPDGAAGSGIPARPYLGLSTDNRTAIEDLVIGRLEDLLQ